MLNDKEIRRSITEKDLVRDFIHLDTQVTPNGFDLTVGKIFRFDGCGCLDFSNQERKIPLCKEILPKKKNNREKFGWWNLKKGAYKIRTNETVNLPKDLAALGLTRSSLLRMGAFTQTAVWDAGFIGKSEFILVVDNPNGMKIKQNARIIQLVFFKTKEVKKSYQGIYQMKNRS